MMVMKIRDYPGTVLAWYLGTPGADETFRVYVLEYVWVMVTWINEIAMISWGSLV